MANCKELSPVSRLIAGDIVPANSFEFNSKMVITPLEQVTPVQVMEQGREVAVLPVQVQPEIDREPAGQFVMPCLKAHNAFASDCWACRLIIAFACAFVGR